MEGRWKLADRILTDHLTRHQKYMLQFVYELNSRFFVVISSTLFAELDKTQTSMGDRM